MPEASSHKPEGGSSAPGKPRAGLRFTIYGLRALAFLLCGLLVTAAGARAQEPITPQARSAVDRGLEYMAKRQAPDGEFPCNMRHSTAVTSLATMAFLARGHVPGQGVYGALVNRAIDAVLSQQHDSGLLSGTSGSASMYDHGISTVMLCEACGMVDETRRRKIDLAVAKAVKLILDAQRVPKSVDNQGGWRYSPQARDSDISVTGWQLMALRAAANCGAAVPPEAIADGVKFIRRRAMPSGGFSYTDGGPVNEGRTGTGILALELLGTHESREALAGGDYLLQTTHGQQGEHYYYAVYYCAQAANQLGGKYWDGIYKPLRDAILARQLPSGAWPVVGGEDAQAGEMYTTSMSILALTVPMHYLPLYQK